uniref:Uncharacterized protein n=1 Tax=Rhizophora mucronata TaxID=61149 RepID=A0A2P2NL94_RHIMU
MLSIIVFCIIVKMFKRLRNETLVIQQTKNSSYSCLLIA